MNQYISPRSKLFAHPDRLAAIRAGGRPAPVNVEIDLSNRCSLGCSWCHFAYTHTRGPLAGKHEKPPGHIDGGDLMEEALAYRVLEELAAAGVKSVTWTGGGEPTLHPQFDAVCAHAHGLGLEQGMYTHGGHIDAKRAAMLKEAFKWVYISLDECTPEAYKASKGVGRFDKVLENVHRLVRADGDAVVGLGFLLHEGNCRDVHSMVRLGKELGVHYVQFRPTIRYEQATPQQLAEEAVWVDRAVGMLNAYRDDPFVIADVERFRMYQHWQGHNYPTCFWAAMQTVITPNGKVWRCLNKREHGDALLGDLSVEPFADLWARAGGPCAVDGTCRIMCRGHIPNLTLDAVMGEPTHRNFI